MPNKDQNIPVTGMSSAPPMNIKDSEYPLMVNGNIQTDISGPVTLTNEHSNILCLREKFTAGYKVIGFQAVADNNLTYFFLVNPSTGDSEIGYIEGYTYNPVTDTPGPNPCINCDTIDTEAVPLEQQNQYETCVYNCIAKNPCLNFNIDFPIRKVVIKKDNCGTTLYFTDFNNPVRALKLTPDNLLDNSIRGIDHYICGDAPSPIYPSCEAAALAGCTCCQPVYSERCSTNDVDCDKIRLFPQTKHICVKPEEVVSGGTLRAGTYQLAPCYADKNGQRATRTFSCSNPVSIFDPVQTITTETSYVTGYGVKFLIENLDSAHYKFIDIFIVANINTVSSVKQYATIDISSIKNGTLEYILSDFEKGKDVAIDDILQVFPVYEKAQEITSSGDLLLLSDLTAPRDLNLQKAVIGMSTSIKWVTSEVNEWFYKDGANAANYREYLRDEVYPLGIVFERNNTLDTCVYPFVGRELDQNFGVVETSACTTTWETWFTGATASFITDPGYSIFNYVGAWIPTRTYNPRDAVNHTPYDVVLFGGLYYVCLATSLGNTEDPTNIAFWLELPSGVETNTCFRSVKDSTTISFDNKDAFTPPGCGTPLVDYSEYWRVYNTATNLGLTCSPQVDTVSCTDEVDTITCNSFTFQVPTIQAAWVGGTGPTTLTLTTTTDPSTLNLVIGSTVIFPDYTSTTTPCTLTAVGPGNSLTVTIPTGVVIASQGTVSPLANTATVSFLTYCGSPCSNTNQCVPTDCYVDKTYQCIHCSDNYNTDLSSVTHCTTCGCPSWPPTTSPNICGTSPTYVRTKTQAQADSITYGGNLLCIDATLLSYSSLLSDPYVVKIKSDPVKVLDAITKDWYVYDLLNIQSLIVESKDPTAAFVNGVKGPEDPVCLNGAFLYSYPGQPLQNYLLAGINMPSDIPSNYDPNNAITAFNPSPENKCTNYGVTAPLMYMLGHNLSKPVPPCCGGAGEDCDVTNWNGDYWNIGAESWAVWDNTHTYAANDTVIYNSQKWKAVTPVLGVAPSAGPWTLLSEVNDSKYESYWYSFTATASQPTIIIKSKIGYKYGDFVAVGHTPSTTPGSKDFQEQYDFRIDVYEDSFNTTPKWSTGEDSVNPAEFYYTSTEADQGVLIIGDVANSTGQTTTAGQIPLIPGTTYYVHIYLLPQGINKVNKTPLTNGNKTHPCVSYDATKNSSCCPCYFANYAYMNLCMNSATSNKQIAVSLPETWELQCQYELHYREYKLVDNGCNVQTYDYGNFAYWQSATNIYPTSTYVDQSGNTVPVWGDLCGQPIRHFKFPDVLVSNIQNQDPTITFSSGNYVPGSYNPSRTAKVYPIGLRVDPQDVMAWLDWAVLEGLITQTERNDITGYKIVRGNRVGNKSIAAKGLLFDMRNYKEYDWETKSYSSLKTYYANYPFNDLRPDPYLDQAGNKLTQPFTSHKNNRFSFVSPETTFNSPVIGDELKIESAVYGDSLGNFYVVKNHPEYILLSGGGIALASALAAVQLSGDLLIAIGSLLGEYIAGTTFTIPVGSIVGSVGEFIDLIPKFFIYAQQWKTLITNFGVLKNFTKYYAGVGNYHSSGVLGSVFNIGNKRRQIFNYTYLQAGNMGVSDEGVLSKINNYEREDSVYLYLGDSGLAINYTNTILANNNNNFADTSRFIMSGGTDNQSCRLTNRQSKVASLYASIKYNVPDQYGALQDIQWLYTGTCVEFNEVDSYSVCKPIYGGDTFLSRMTQKRKIPFFIDNPVGATSNVDFQYRKLSNISNATYFFNSVGESIATSSNIQFLPVEHNFDCDQTGKSLYLNGTIYLFSYGIISFICESDLNLNFRYAQDNKGKDFYPHQSDIGNWTQEYRVPIETPNAYLYNIGYSKQNKENFFCNQPTIYRNDLCITTYKNRVINSLPDEDSDFYTDPWRVFLANDYHDFPLTNGQLVGMDGIEREKVLLRFVNTSWVFNAFYTITTDAGVAQIGTGNMFAQKPIEYAKTDIGYGGTQHHAFVSTQMGHFWVDAKRSAVFMLPSGDSPLQEISESYNYFFNNNLPFFILKAFPDYPVDNNFKQIGISIGWDNKFDRLFLTKLDYELHPEYLGIITYINDKFMLGSVEVFLTDEKYFCNKSWSMAYSPLTKTWISFYSFVPNYYIGHDNYFQTGINYSQNNDINELGIWNHLISNKSYQVFYGKLYPFITDVIVKEQLINKQLHSIEYQADFLRFQNDYDYFYNTRVTFNKMVIWSENRNTGNLELVPQVPNNMAQSLLYPRTNPDSTSVLVTRKSNNWRVNQFWDLVRNKYNNVPPMIYDCHPYLKHVNHVAIDYTKPTFERSRLLNDYFTLRFINDKYSNYKILNKWFINKFMQSYS